MISVQSKEGEGEGRREGEVEREGRGGEVEREGRGGGEGGKEGGGEVERGRGREGGGEGERGTIVVHFSTHFEIHVALSVR